MCTFDSARPTVDSARPTVKRWLAAGAIALAIAVALQSPTVVAQAAVQGQWRTLPYVMPINPSTSRSRTREGVDRGGLGQRRE